MTFAELRAGSTRRRVPKRLLRFVLDLVGYGLASILALACDYGLLLGLTDAGLPYLVASTLSFSVGMAVAYVFSVCIVFADRRSMAPGVEAAHFIAIGIAGLALTQLLLFVFVSRFGWTVAIAKLPTTGVVFAFNFLCRRTLLFSASS